MRVPSRGWASLVEAPLRGALASHGDRVHRPWEAVLGRSGYVRKRAITKKLAKITL